MVDVLLSLKLNTPLKGRNFEPLRGGLVTTTTAHWLQCYRKAVSGSSFDMAEIKSKSEYVY
jgi:hypothetical protein